MKMLSFLFMKKRRQQIQDQALRILFKQLMKTMLKLKKRDLKITIH